MNYFASLALLPLLCTLTCTLVEGATVSLERLETSLQQASSRMITTITDRSKKKFQANTTLEQKQKDACKGFQETVLSRITAATPKGSDAFSINFTAISTLEPEEMIKLCRHITGFMQTLPPLPAHISLYARTITPFITFNTQARRSMETLLTRWFAALLESQDELTTLSKLPQVSKDLQKAQMIALRGEYDSRTDQHAASQILTFWVQVCSGVDPQTPFNLFCDIATQDSQKTKRLLDQLTRMVLDILKKDNPQTTTKDAQAFILVAIAILFAPDSLFTHLYP